MCGRFDTSHLTWADIHDQLATFAPVATSPINLEPNADVRPTTAQLTARLEDGSWTLQKMRWGLVPFWRNGKPLKDTAKGAGDGFKLTTFNCRVESCATSSTFKGAFARRRCVVPASAWFEWTGDAGSKVKHRFARLDGQPIWFAGLWDRCSASDVGEVTSFTIMTGPSAAGSAFLRTVDWTLYAAQLPKPRDDAGWDVGRGKSNHHQCRERSTEGDADRRSDQARNPHCAPGTRRFGQSVSPLRQRCSQSGWATNRVGEDREQAPSGDLRREETPTYKK